MAEGTPDQTQRYSPYLLLHNVLRILAADGCQPKPDYDEIAAVRAARELAAALGINPAAEPGPADRASIGPFETEEEVLAQPAVKAIYDAASTSYRIGAIAEGNHRVLDEAIAGAGVTLGSFDHRVITWLANYGPPTCVAVAALIRRAHAAGVVGQDAGDAR